MLDRAGLTHADVDRIVSGASGSIAGDRLEAHTLRETWEGDPLPPILAPKGVTGEYGGGLLAAAILAASNQEFGPTAGFSDPDPELGVTPHGGGPLPPSALTLVTTIASGGTAAWLLLEGV
jgi:3-oxoacyl-(acyl-carrier-protein) synthase